MGSARSDLGGNFAIRYQAHSDDNAVLYLIADGRPQSSRSGYGFMSRPVTLAAFWTRLWSRARAS